MTFAVPVLFQPFLFIMRPLLKNPVKYILAVNRRNCFMFVPR
uniref:Uncharacterized protein n=1 Tax=Anguilla anguilla TaxID=7936 RepID=A0A0E9UCU2_ANGAN